MLALPLLVAALAAEPTPEPSTAPLAPSAAAAPARAATGAPPTPLTEIGRVRGRTICTSIVVHANAAIDGALDNDRTLALTIAKLTTLDVENTDEVNRQNSIREIDKLATQMRIQAMNGEGEVRRLRELAALSTDPERKTELRNFADALGGALYRQRFAALELQRMTVIMNGRRQADDGQDLMMTPIQRVNQATDPRWRGGPGRSRSGRENEQLRTAANDLSERVPLIAADEGVAADHSLGATTGC